MNSNGRPIRVACLGGGQLGRMMALEAPRFNVQMYFYDPGGMDCPAAQVVPSQNIAQGSLTNNTDAIVDWVLNTVQADVVTTEIEHVDSNALKQLEATKKVSVQPSGAVLALIQDKYQQKVHFDTVAKVPVAPYVICDSISDIQTAAQQLGLPLMLKARTGAYDGRGNAVLRDTTTTSINEALQQLGRGESSDASENNNTTTALGLYAEGWIDFHCEVAVIVARSAAKAASTSSNNETSTTDNESTTTTTRCYPAVNAIQQNSICRIVIAPARDVSEQVRNKAEQIAIAAIDSLPNGASGVFGVELFVTKDDDNVVLLNEVAPRPHNTGHYTQDACSVSQFEQHLRGVCGMPLGSTHMIVEAAAMVNILGRNEADMDATITTCNTALSMDRATLHWYGKGASRLGRKLGHINVTANSHGELDQDLQKLLQLEGIPETLLPRSLSVPTPLVGVIMGSQSDLPTMQDAVKVLQQFQIPYEVDIVSAHRTPDKLLHYSRSAAGRGMRVLIAGAGGAAHLPGMVAALTPLPVIGVPVKTSTLSGVDSLYSIVQMPRGVPVATVAIGNAMNAGLLAVRILSTSRPELRDQMVAYQRQMKEAVDESSANLLSVGSDVFLSQMDNKNTSVNV